MAATEHEPSPHMITESRVAVHDLLDPLTYDEVARLMDPEDVRVLTTVANILGLEHGIPKEAFMLGAIAQHRQLLRREVSQHQLPPDPTIVGDGA